jgi:hypothetical protein
MADLNTFLTENGMTAEEIAGLTEKQKAVLATALGKYDEGTSAQAKAAEQLTEAQKFWDEKVTPALSGVDKRVATAEAERARYAAYLKSLKDQGYDVPDDLVAAPKPPENRDPETGKFVTPEAMQKEFRSVAPTMVSLVSLSNEYQDLYGTPYVNGDADWQEAQNARKPFREFVREKYSFAAKTAERNSKREQERIDAKVAEQLKAKEAELVAKYGSNGELRSPMPSMHDRLNKSHEGNRDSWKSDAGRREARKDRRERFANLTLQ